MAQITSGDAHGLWKIFVGLVGTDGYNYGVSGQSAANGTLLAPYAVRYPKSASVPTPDRQTVDFTGGDVWTGSFVYGFTSLGSFTMETSTMDGTLIALVGDSAIDNTTNTRMTLFAENVMLPTPPQTWILLVWRIQSKEVGSKGANKYLHTFIPRCWVSPKGATGGPSFQTASPYQYQITPTISDVAPWGFALSETAMGLEDNETPMFYAITDYPLHVVGFKAEAGATEVVTLPYKPAPFTYTSPDSSTMPVQCYVDGVQFDATTINATTGAVTLTDTFAGGEYIGILYETDDYTPT